MTPIRDAWESVWRRRDLRPVHEWARENTDLKAPLTITGAFDVSRSRHFIGPLEALQDDHVREVNILKPVRGGGTLIADIWVAWARVNDPGPTMFVLQTDPLADDHFEKVLYPTIESVPEIKSMLGALGRHAKTGRKIEFADGNHLHINGPSIGNLQSNAFRYVVEDECWIYPLGRMGDAEARVGDFAKLETSKILRVSQGGPQERLPLSECPWYRAYCQAGGFEWEVKCPLCSKPYQPVFSGAHADGTFWGITWDKHKLPNGDWNLAKCVPTTRFECPHCRVPIVDSARNKSEWNRVGSYLLTTDENRKRKSYHWETVIDYPWDELVELWLDACNAERRGDLMPKLQFYQKRRALFRDLETLKRLESSMRRTAYEINGEWPEEVGRFMSVDRQDEELFWWTVRAWSRGKSRRLGFGKCYGFAAVDEQREKLKVPANRVLIDSAFVPKGDRGVYAACLKYGWTPVVGSAEYSFVHKGKKRSVLKSYTTFDADPDIGTKGEGRKLVRVIRFSKPTFNELVQQLIDHGHWEEPAGGADPEMEKEYNGQMASRMKLREFNKKTNEVKEYWWEGKNDHARDLANANTLGAVLCEFVPDPMEEKLTKSEEKALTE